MFYSTINFYTLPKIQQERQPLGTDFLLLSLGLKAILASKSPYQSQKNYEFSLTS